MTTPQLLPADLDRMERVLESYAASASIAYLGRNEVTAGDARALIAAVRAAQRPEADKPKCPTCGGSRFVVVGSPVAGNIIAHNEPCPTCVSPTDKLRKAHGTLVDVEDLPPHLQEILRDPKAPAPLPADAGKLDEERAAAPVGTDAKMLEAIHCALDKDDLAGTPSSSRDGRSKFEERWRVPATQSADQFVIAKLREAIARAPASPPPTSTEGRADLRALLKDVEQHEGSDSEGIMVDSSVVALLRALVDDAGRRP